MPQRNSLHELAQRQRNDLLRGDDQVLAKIAALHEGTKSYAEQRLADLSARINARIAAGASPGVALELERIRFENLLADLGNRARSNAAEIAEIAAERRMALGRQGLADSSALMANGAARAQIALADLNRAPIEAVQELIAQFDARSPLTALMNSAAIDGAARLREVMERELLRGENPRRIGREIAKALDLPRHRSQVIARTESMRAYRAATLTNYQANAEYLAGWIWLSGLGPRTCAACLAQHGTLHPLDEEMAEHPSGRCTQIPKVKGDDRSIESGSDWFARQRRADQRQILGPKGLAIYDGGKPLSAWIHTTNDPKWGRTNRARTPA